MSTAYIGNVKQGNVPPSQLKPHHLELLSREPRKISWWRRWFMKQSKQAWEDSKTDHYPAPVHGPSVSAVQEFESPQADGLRIHVYGATGGNIVEFRRYDIKTDRNSNKLYVIPTEQNFVESFAKIVSMEMIR